MKSRFEATDTFSNTLQFSLCDQTEMCANQTNLRSSLAIRLYVQDDAGSNDAVDGYDLVDWYPKQFIRVEFPAGFVECLVRSVVVEPPHKSFSAGTHTLHVFTYYVKYFQTFISS